MPKKPKLSVHGQKALDSLREAVAEAIVRHRQNRVPIVVRHEKSVSRRASALVCESEPPYGRSGPRSP
jgi:hypothetical protein